MDKIVFDAETHTYYLDGVKIPSCTQVLESGGVSDFSKVPKRILELSREKGTNIHLLTELHDKKILDGSSIDPELIGYYKAWLQFLDDHKPEIIAIELLVYSELRRFAGQIDRVLKIGDKTILLDIKSGEYYPSYSIQLAGYEYALKESHDISVDEKWCVLLAPTGGYKIKKAKDKTDISVFLSCVNIAHWKINKGVN